MRILLLFIAAVLANRVASRPPIISQGNATESNNNTQTKNSEENEAAISSNIKSTSSNVRNRPLSTVYDDIISTIASPCPVECNCYAEIIAHCGPTEINDLPCDRLSGDSSNNPVNAFSQNVQSIYLNFNRVRSIPENCLYASGRNLNSLHLQNNMINHIEVGAFNGLNRLEHLDLQENELTSLTFLNQSGTTNISVSVFGNLSQSLLSLQLSFNKIQGIPNTAFADFGKLRLLSLSHNRISWIALTAFEDLRSLRFLNLRGNPLSQVSRSQIGEILSWFARPQIFSDYDEATLLSSKLPQNSECASFISASGDDISLRKKRQVEFSSDYLTDQQEIQRQSQKMKLGALETLDLGELNLTSIPENLTRSLKILYLDKNLISELCVDSLLMLSNLEALYLSHNNINQLTDGTFAYLQKLHLLDLSNNIITQISSNALCGLQNLRILRLYKNPELRQLPEKVFRHTKSLHLLYLQECGLETLPTGPWLYRIKVAWLYGNPLQCDCGTIAPLLVALKYRTSANPDRLQLDPYKKSTIDDLDVWPDIKPEHTLCYSRPFYQERRITNVKPTELKCSVEDWRKIIVHRRLSVAISFSEYQSDEPSFGHETEFFKEEDQNDTMELETKDQKDYFSFELGDGDLSKEDYNEIYEMSVNNLIKNGSLSDNTYDTPDLANNNEKEFQHSNNEDNIFLIDEDEQENIDSTLGPVRKETNSTESNEISDQKTEWLIELAAPIDVTDSFSEPFEMADLSNDTAVSDLDQEQFNSSAANSTKKTNESSNNAFLEAVLNVDDDDDYWESYDEQYFDADQNTRSKPTSNVNKVKLAEIENASDDSIGTFTDFESDYLSWLGLDQWTSLKSRLETFDLYQEFESYYYSSEPTATDFDEMIAAMFNVTDDGEQYWEKK